MDEKTWKITVAYDNDGYPMVDEGARYTLEAPASYKPDEVAYLAIRDAVARQFKLAPSKRCDYITVGVWVTGDGHPRTLAVWTAKWLEPQDNHGNWMGGQYVHPSGPSIEPSYLGTARTAVDYDEWEKP